MDICWCLCCGNMTLLLGQARHFLYPITHLEQMMWVFLMEEPKETIKYKHNILIKWHLLEVMSLCLVWQNKPQQRKTASLAFPRQTFISRQGEGAIWFSLFWQKGNATTECLHPFINRERTPPFCARGKSLEARKNITWCWPITFHSLQFPGGMAVW